MGLEVVLLAAVDQLLFVVCLSAGVHSLCPSNRVWQAGPTLHLWFAGHDIAIVRDYGPGVYD